MRLLFLLTVVFSIFSGCATTREHQKETALLHLQIATAHIKSQNYPLALKELLVAEENDPTNAMVQANLGLVYFMRERYELSEKHYKNAIQLLPTFTEAKNNLARSYIEIGKFKEAEPLLKEVLADLTYVNYPSAHANYGLLEFRKQNYTQANIHFRKALERDRENCFAQVYLGRSYLEQKNISLAVAQLDRAVPFCRQAESDEAHYYSAIALYRDGQKDKARSRFEELIKAFPNGANYEKAQKMLALIKAQ